MRGSSQRYIFKSPNIKLPVGLLNRIEVALKEVKKKIGDKFVYFSNVNHGLKVTQRQAFIATEKSNDHNHKKADTKLVAPVEAANFANGKTVMIRSPAADIDIIMLLLSC